MRITRASLGLAATLSCAVLAAAPPREPAPSVWPLDVAWSRDFPLGSEFSLVPAEALLLVVAPTQVAAHAWSDGMPVWTNELEATAAPVVADGLVFVPTNDDIHALSDVSGNIEWSLQTGRVSTSPAARAGWLIVAGDDRVLRGVSTADGRVIWQREMPGALVSAVVVDGDLIAGGFSDGSVVGWSITDGTVRWTTPIGTRPNRLLAASGRVFVAGNDGSLINLRQRDGDLQWAYHFKMAIVGDLAADSRNVYVSTNDNSVRAHAFNGNQRWRRQVASRLVDGLFVDSGTVLAPQSTGEIRMFLAEGGRRSGRLLPPAAEANVTGGLVAGGTGGGLRMALTTSVGSRQTVTAYRRLGLDVTMATTGPPSAPLPLTRPPGRP